MHTMTSSASSRILLDGSLEERDAVGQGIAVPPAAFGQRRALVETVERIRRLDLQLGEQLRDRLVFEHDRDVLHRLAKARRDVVERLLDEAVEFLRVTSRAAACARPT